MEFSLLVRERRRELGLSAAEVSKRLGLSRVYYSSIENARALPSDDKLHVLVDVLALSDGAAAELIDLSQQARARGWWQDYSRVLTDPDFVDFLGLEQGASQIRIHETQLVTGLLQTRNYAQAIHAADPTTRLADADDHVAIRLRRQARLTDPDGPLVDVIMSESVLMQTWGSREILHEQLRSLLQWVREHTGRIKVRIQPFDSTPLGLSNTSTLVLFDFADSHLGVIGYREVYGAVDLTQDSEIVKGLELHFAQASSSALSLEDSADLIEKRSDELRRLIERG